MGLFGMPDPEEEKNRVAKLAAGTANVVPPQGLDPLEGVKNMARDAANTVRGQFAPQPRPVVNPLMGPDTGSTVLPMLQAADTYMRGKQDAALSNAKDVPGTVASGVQSLVDAGRAENQRIQAIDNSPQERPGTFLGGLNNLGAYVKNGLLDAGVLDKQLVARADVLTPEQQHSIKPPLPQASYSNEGRGVSTPVSAAPAVPAVPEPAKESTPEQKVQLAALIARQNNSRTPVADPYAPVPGTQPQGAMGMPPPAGANTPDRNGTPAQQTAYWEQQKAGLQERERYTDQLNAQSQAMSMMQADQDFKQKMFDYVKDKQDTLIKGRGLDPATLQALSHLSGQNSGAGQPAAAGLAGLASMSNHATAASGDVAKNAVTARGQDLAYEGHKLTGANDMAKAKLRAEVDRDGFANQAGVHAASDATALQRAQIAADTAIAGQAMQDKIMQMKLGAWEPSPLAPDMMVNKKGQRKKATELVPKE